MFPTDLWDNTSVIVCFLFVLSLIELVILSFGRRETETDQESFLWAFIRPDGIRPGHPGLRVGFGSSIVGSGSYGSYQFRPI